MDRRPMYMNSLTTDNQRTPVEHRRHREPTHGLEDRDRFDGLKQGLVDQDQVLNPTLTFSRRQLDEASTVFFLVFT